MISPEARQMALDLIHEAVAAGARQERACEILEITARTLRRWEKQLSEEQALADRRPAAARERTPSNKLTEEEKVQIITLCNQPEYQSLPPSQIVPRLADQGAYIASESSFYRVLHEAEQVHRRGRTSPPRSVEKPKGYLAKAPNQVWSWDITYLATAILGVFYRLYLIVDLFSRKIVGWEVHDKECAEYASGLIQRACLAEGIHWEGLVLHADNGGPMRAAIMLATLQKLGVIPSFSRPAVSDDNPYSESLFRTLKYTPAYPSQPFESIEAARQWVHEFVQWYNHVHQHSAIRYVTPNQRHRGEDHVILEARQAVYQTAKKKHPQRWSGDIRNWDPVTEVWLNPAKEATTEEPDLLKAV